MNHRTLSARGLILDIVIIVVSVAAALGVVGLLRWSLDLPDPQVPLLPIIIAAVVTARLAPRLLSCISASKPPAEP
jgi:predicted RND superfamily exporter protein